MSSDDLVEGVDESSSPEGPQEGPQRSCGSHLQEKHHAASPISRDGCPVAPNEPPAVPPRVLGDARQEPSSLLVSQWKQRERCSAVESCDDTRREPAKPSGARVEQNSTRERRVRVGARHEGHTPWSTTAGASGRRLGRACDIRQGVAATTSPLAAVSPATTTIAALAPAASATNPARSAPSANPASRQKRYTPTAGARSRGCTASETAAMSVG